MKIIKLKKISSTNDYIQNFVAEKSDVVVVAKSQTSGRGTKGRSFFSASGGIYLSMLKFYDELKATDAFSIIRDASVAVVKTLEQFLVSASIKWPNDIIVSGKKICGILTENTLVGDRISSSIVGIGLNVNNKLPKELKDIAVSLKQVVGKTDVDKVTDVLLKNLEKRYDFNEYVKYSCVLGRKVEIQFADKTVFDTAEEILPDGRIRLSDNGVVSQAEIKLNL